MALTDDDRVLREGPVPVLVHGALEYLGALFALSAPFLFGFDSAAASATAVVAGLLLLVLTATSDLPTGLVRRIPAAIHATLDVVAAVFLVAAPFLFGFDDEAAPTWFFLAFGVVLLLLTIATRFPARRAEQR